MEPQTPTPIERVAQNLIDGIRNGHLTPGQRLIESELATRLQVARTSVREALQRLEAMGLLIQTRHRGFLIRTMTRDRLCDVYAVRESLEGMIARLATAKFHATPEPLLAAITALDAAADAQDMKRFTEANGAFHALIRTAAANAVADEILERLELSVYHMQFRLLVEQPKVFFTNDGHRRMTDAMIAGDADLAAEEARAHVRDTLAELLRLPSSVFIEG